tara:strand:+ start:356 stop:568 length:213 start_codon:yes stop_codon:yes gene_type:complete
LDGIHGLATETLVEDLHTFVGVDGARTVLGGVHVRNYYHHRHHYCYCYYYCYCYCYCYCALSTIMNSTIV